MEGDSGGGREDGMAGGWYGVVEREGGMEGARQSDIRRLILPLARH